MGNDVLCCCPRGAQIFPAWTINQRLRSRVGVDGGHSAKLNTEAIVQRFRHRCQAVGGARCDRDNPIVRIHCVVVDVKDNGLHVASRGGYQHFFGPCIQVRVGFFCRGIKTGAFDDYLSASGFPRNIFGLFFCVNRDFFTVDNQRVFGKVDAPGKRAVV